MSKCKLDDKTTIVLQHAASQGLGLSLGQKMPVILVFKPTPCLTRNFAYAW